MNTFCSLIIAVIISELAGIIGSIFTASSIYNWYAPLIKPPLTPPGWVFGPVWITLYLMMGVAAHLVWQNKNKFKGAKTAFIIFGVQLVLNTLWSIIFFGWHLPSWAFIEIVVLWFAILWTIIAFYKISRTAAYLLIPYILWVSFAAYLNFYIWLLNKPPI